jgi:hypothetical protein
LGSKTAAKFRGQRGGTSFDSGRERARNRFPNDRVTPIRLLVTRSMKATTWLSGNAPRMLSTGWLFDEGEYRRDRYQVKHAPHAGCIVHDRIG